MPGRQDDWVRQTKESSSTVKIFYFPKEKVWAALRSVAKQMSAQFPEIERILVFGSVARGQATPGSDVDLLIILNESTERPLDRIPRYMPSRFPVGVDVFPYTRQELDEMVKQNNFFVKRALKEGIELFRRR